MINALVLDWGNVSDRGVQTAGFVPVHPGRSRRFDLAPAGPGARLTVDEFGLVEADRGFHHGVVNGVADGADRSGDPGVDERFGERERGVLATRVRVVHEPVRGELETRAPSGEQRLFHGREHQRRRLRGGHLPTQDPPRVPVRDEGHVAEPRERSDVDIPREWVVKRREVGSPVRVCPRRLPRPRF